MHITRHSVLCLFLVACCLLSAVHAATAGDAIKYPEKTPLLSLAVPKGWNYKEMNNAATTFVAIPADDENTLFGMGLLEKGSSDEVAAIRTITEVARATAVKLKMSDIQIGDTVQEPFGNGIRSVSCLVRGKLDGKDTTVLVRWFMIDDQPILSYQLSPNYAKFAKAFGSITSSFKSLR